MTKRCVYIVLILVSLGCIKNPPDPSDIDLSDIAYEPKAFDLKIPSSYREPTIDETNPLTVDGVRLGQHLFYDPILSIDSTVSCANCHQITKSFTDGAPVSTGVLGRTGNRSAMSLLDVAYHRKGFFWDGRSATLHEQAIVPIEDMKEMNNRLVTIVNKLIVHDLYPTLFRKAFGIAKAGDISADMMLKALVQFQQSIISSGESKYDRVLRNEAFFTPAELNGFVMFFDTDPRIPDAECAHCHAAPTFINDDYMNNGIEPDISSFGDFADKGYGIFTTQETDNGKFKVPTLRNIALTSPYMHDGRFATLEEVIDHYNSGGHPFINVDPLIRPLNLTPKQKSDLLAFLHTLTDTTVLNAPHLQNPF